MDSGHFGLESITVEYLLSRNSPSAGAFFFEIPSNFVDMVALAMLPHINLYSEYKQSTVGTAVMCVVAAKNQNDSACCHGCKQKTKKAATQVVCCFVLFLLLAAMTGHTQDDCVFLACSHGP